MSVNRSKSKDARFWLNWRNSGAVDSGKPKAVLMSELQQFGCPYCGYRSGYSPFSGDGAMVWICGECNRSCCGLADGLTRSPIGLGNYHPILKPHPRRGVASHGRPDRQPSSNGEYFRPRGIGLDRTPGCFVCGGEDDVHTSISAFVQCKEAGERVVAMFKSGARLDHRRHEPDRVQVKIGVCDTHVSNLKKMMASTNVDGLIDRKRVNEASS